MLSKTKQDENREIVVLLHGLAAHRILMRILSNRLERQRFETMSWGYRSIRGKIEIHASRLTQLLHQFDRDSTISKVHVVAHSMGAIITRTALTGVNVQKISRVVMLGPPNRGSPVAAKLSRVFGFICPSLLQLSDQSDSFVNGLSQLLPCEVGIIAASRDRVVPIDNTHLHGQTDHVVVKSGHNGLLFRQVVHDHVDHFLRHACFVSQSPSLAPNTDSHPAQVAWTGRGQQIE